MKKHLISFMFITLVLAVISLSLFAQDIKPKPKEIKLQGIWQLCMVKEINGQPEMHIMPYLKILGSDGKFTNLIIRVTDGGCVITEFGTYTQPTDSTYEEKIDFANDSALINCNNVINFQLQGPQWMINKYTSPNDNHTYRDIWMRVDAKKIPLMENTDRFLPKTGTRPFPQHKIQKNNSFSQQQQYNQMQEQDESISQQEMNDDN